MTMHIIERSQGQSTLKGHYIMGAAKKKGNGFHDTAEATEVVRLTKKQCENLDNMAKHLFPKEWAAGDIAQTRAMAIVRLARSSWGSTAGNQLIRKESPELQAEFKRLRHEDGLHAAAAWYEIMRIKAGKRG